MIQLVTLAHFAQIPQTVRHGLQPNSDRISLWHVVRRQAHLFGRGRRHC